jgi:hypothetical protein
MYSQRVVSFRYALDHCFLQLGVNCEMVIVVCFTSLDRDHGTSWKFMTVISLFTVYGLWRHRALFYLIAPSEMKLGFCIRVSLQVLLVNIRMKSGKFLKVYSTWKKDLCLCLIWAIANYRQWLIFYRNICWTEMKQCDCVPFDFVLNKKRKGNERKQILS